MASLASMWGEGQGPGRHDETQHRPASSSTTHHYHQPPPWSFSAASAVAKLRCALHLNQLKLAKARILFFTFTLSFSKLHLGLIGAFSCDWASTKLQQTINLTGEQWSAQRRGGARGEEPLTNVNLQQSLSANAKSVLDLDMIYLTLLWHGQK